MEEEGLIYNSYKKVIDYLIRSDFSSHDPYDGANSKLFLIKNNKYGKFVSTYLNKFSPVNIRFLFQVPKSRQNQAIAYIARAMLSDQSNYKNEIQQLTDHFISESLIERYGYHCWDAHGFPLQIRFSYLPVGTIDIIGSEAIASFFYELYKIKPEEEFKQVCLSVRDFIQNELSTHWEQKKFFRYTPKTPMNKWCYNASVIAASYVARISEHFNDNYNKDFVNQAVLDVVSAQKSTGEWWYSLDLDMGYEKPQVDFHQGFILDALLEYMTLTGFEEPLVSAYKKGLDFYFNKQFLPNGRGIYRYPKKWPADIHNQAQGIITFTRAAKAGFGDHFDNFARTIAEWTINNMQDRDGHFYFLKYPLFTNKIPYIRWSDANMSFALSVLLSK